MHPEKLEEIASEFAQELDDLQARAPSMVLRPDRTELGWMARRGRRLCLAIEDRRSGTVLVLSIWTEDDFGAVYPVRNGQFELAAHQLPTFSSILAKGVRLVRDRVQARLGSARQGGER